jgi:perosamine synthetase
MISISKPFNIKKAGKEIQKIISKDWISSSGQNVVKFEKLFAKFVGAKYAISMSNGTVALISGLSLVIKENDFVALPALTFGACANAILSVCAKPVFIDTEKDKWLISFEDLKNKYKKTPFKALINVHLNGYATADIVKIKKFCKKNKIFLIEDCAEAFGTRINKKHVGTYGDIGTFSLFANKTITTGEGGMCVTNNFNIAKKIKILRDHGMDPKKKYWHIIKGYNHRMTNLQATIGISQMKQLKKIFSLRKKVYSQYIDELKFESFFDYIEAGKNTKPIMWYFPFTINKKFKFKKKALLFFLRKNFIETRNFFYPLDQMKVFSKKAICKNSNEISKRSFYLPLYPDLKIKNVNFICKKIKFFFENKKLKNIN